MKKIVFLKMDDSIFEESKDLSEMIRFLGLT